MFPERRQNFVEFALPIAHKTWASKFVMAMTDACYRGLVRGPHVGKE